MEIIPNFNFDGQCNEAIQLYQRAFNGKVIHCIVDEEKNDALIETKKRIYHAEMMIGEQRIMMCDNKDVPFQPSPSLSLTIIFDTKDDVLHAYEILKDGGTILYQVQKTAYSSCFVSLFDRFGFRWVLMAESVNV